MNFIDNILSFVTDRNKKLSTRATIVILSVVALLALDNILGFTYNYKVNQKLEQLESVSELLEEEILTSGTRKELRKIELETVEREDVLDLFSRFVSSIELPSNDNSSGRPSGERNNFWFLITSSGLYILVSLLFVPVLLFTDKETHFGTLITGMIMFLLIMAFTSWFNYWLMGVLIPDQLFGSWGWNYFANLLIQIGLIFAYNAAGNYAKKPKHNI